MERRFIVNMIWIMTVIVHVRTPRLTDETQLLLIRQTHAAEPGVGAGGGGGSVPRSHMFYLMFRLSLAA